MNAEMLNDIGQEVLRVKKVLRKIYVQDKRITISNASD